MLKQLDRYHALVIDDIGYVQQSREEMEVLFNLLAHRYERGSVMVTSNLPFSKGDQIFKDQMTTAAAIRPPCTPLRRPRTRRRTQLPARRIQEARQWIIIRRKWEISETGRSGEGSRYQGRGDRPSQSI